MMTRRTALQALGMSALGTYMVEAGQLGRWVSSPTTGYYKPEGIYGKICHGFFEPVLMAHNTIAEFPLALTFPGAEPENHAFVIPRNGHLPDRWIGGDYIRVNTYPVSTSIDHLTSYLFVVKKGEKHSLDILIHIPQGSEIPDGYELLDFTKVIEHRYIEKMNSDCWRALIAAAVNRNMFVVDSDVNQGMSLRLISLMKVTMRRNGGGDSSSLRRGKLTDLVLPHEIWNTWKPMKESGEHVNGTIKVDSEGRALNIFNVKIHSNKELDRGGGHDYIMKNEMSIPRWPRQKQRVIMGVDNSRRDSFVLPIRKECTVYRNDTGPDPRGEDGRDGVYCQAEQGVAVLDDRTTLLGAV